MYIRANFVSFVQRGFIKYTALSAQLSHYAGAMVTNLVILQNRVLSGFSTFTVYYTLQWQFSNMQNAGKNSYFEP